jgi:hypothetical protein
MPARNGASDCSSNASPRAAACKPIELTHDPTRREYSESSHRRITKAAEELGTLDYWITSSARSTNECGMVMPSAFAVFRLMTNSNLVGCSMGNSAGIAPLRILSTYTVA